MMIRFESECRRVRFLTVVSDFGITLSSLDAFYILKRSDAVS